MAYHVSTFHGAHEQALGYLSTLHPLLAWARARAEFAPLGAPLLRPEYGRKLKLLDMNILLAVRCAAHAAIRPANSLMQLFREHKNSRADVFHRLNWISERAGEIGEEAEQDADHARIAGLEPVYKQAFFDNVRGAVDACVPCPFPQHARVPADGARAARGDGTTSSS
jgi:hypothetical protein